MEFLPKILRSIGRVIKTYFLIIGFFVVAIIKAIVFGLWAGFLFWLVGLFFHSFWWLLMLISGQPFHFSSGLFRYTVPYAIVGAVLGTFGGFIHSINSGTN